MVTRQAHITVHTILCKGINGCFVSEACKNGHALSGMFLSLLVSNFYSKESLLNPSPVLGNSQKLLFLAIGEGSLRPE